MELSQLHREVDQKLNKLDEEIERFHSNINTSDDSEQRAMLEQDLVTLHTIRDKLVKAKTITQEATDFRSRVEKQHRGSILDRLLSEFQKPKWFIPSLTVIFSGLVVSWLMFM